MSLSSLQKFIITKCAENKSQGKKEDFYGFYSREEISKDKKIIQDTIHRSIDSLVAKDYLVAYGKKTAQKWFIDKVKLTPTGKRVYHDLIISRQRKLPIK